VRELFTRKDIDANRGALLQHAAQLNVLVRATKKKAEVAQRIGFEIAKP